jgi:hypothetical protein
MTNTPSSIQQCVRNAFYEVGENWPDICALHDLAKTETGQGNHNCLACNLADLVKSIELIAGLIPDIKDEFTSNATYMIWLYLLCERMEEVLKIVSLPKEIVEEKFPQMRLIKRWANFFKHPKAFLLVHHPSYDLTKIAAAVLKIDDTYISKYWAGDKHNDALYRDLTNNTKVVVVFPDLCDFTNKLGGELKYLKSLILDNPIYRHVLQSKTVYENYFTFSITSTAG